MSNEHNEGLSISGLSAAHHHGPAVLHKVDLRAQRKKVTALLGPNGAGKSTLLKAVLGLVPASGQILLDGQELRQLTLPERAQRIAYLPQQSQLEARLSARSVVELGRFAAQKTAFSGFASLTKGDRNAADQALERCGVAHLRDRLFPELSGGERKRVLLARALATGATSFLLDEASASLDVKQALALHQTLRELADDGCCIVIVMHDLSEAIQHADDAVLLQDGRVQSFGPVDQVVATKPVRDVYEVELLRGKGLAYRLPSSADDGGSVV